MTRAEEQIELIRQLNETLRAQYDAIVADNTPTRRLTVADLLGRQEPAGSAAEERPADAPGEDDETETPTGQVRPPHPRP